MELLLLIPDSSDTNATSCLLQMVSLTADAIPGWLEVPLDVTVNLGGQAGCYIPLFLIPHSPAMAQPPLFLFCGSSEEFQGGGGPASMGPLGWTPVEVDLICEDPIQRNPQVVFVSCRQAQHNGIDS